MTMTAGSLAFDAFVSGQCPAVGTRRDRRSRRAGKDYCMYDEQGRLLGTVHAARKRPEVGKHAPTLMLDRAWGR